MKDRVYYVYEWYNSKTNEIFYVGKGKGNRYKTVKGRNQYFINYYNKNSNYCEVRMVFENLTEKEAYEKEVEVIAKCREYGMCKCNLDTGGLGGNKMIFENEYHKKLYYDSIRADKCGTPFDLNEIEELLMYDIIDKNFGTYIGSVHFLLFKIIPFNKMMDIAEEYYDRCESMEYETIFINNLIEDGAYGSHDEYWEHIYKY